MPNTMNFPAVITGNKNAIVSWILLKMIRLTCRDWTAPSPVSPIGWDELAGPSFHLDEIEDFGHFTKVVEPYLMWSDMVGASPKHNHETATERFRKSAEAAGYWLLADPRYDRPEVSFERMLYYFFYTIGLAVALTLRSSENVMPAIFPVLERAVFIDRPYTSDCFSVYVYVHLISQDHEKLIYSGYWDREELLYSDFHELIDDIWMLYNYMLSQARKEVEQLG